MGRERWSNDEGFEVPLAPLIDIIFILIVFFLVATTFYSEERDLKVRLPEGDQGTLIEAGDNSMVINVRGEGIIVVADRILQMDELERQLGAFVAAHRSRAKVEIRGDANARHGVIMAIMNLCRKVGVVNYSLTQRIVKTVE
jgi:biopolymer transport protein ExbD